MKLAILLLVGGLLFCGAPATAQCLTLADLLALSQPPPRTDPTTPPTPLTSPTSSSLPPPLPPLPPPPLPGPLAGWVARGPVMPGDAEQYWIRAGPTQAGPFADSLAQGWLGLRPSVTGPAPTAARDVRYKSTQPDCLAGLRRELARARYPVRLVTALSGEAVLFEGPSFSITLYTLTKGQFRYVAVLHPRPPGTPTTPAPPVNRRLLTPAGVPRLMPKY